jgi:hypothetical protein
MVPTANIVAASNGGYRGSVFVTGQQSSRAQRHGRYTPESIQHPAKMLPNIARYLIRTYTNIGDPVCDPMAGIFTTVVEAMHLGRHGIGVEYEPRWAALGADNIRLATTQGAAGTGAVYTGDSRQLPGLIPAEWHGRIALVITSPPYGPSTHGHARTYGPGRGVSKVHHRYGADTNNLAYRDHDDLAAGFGQILAGCVTILRPGGVVAVTARPYRHDGELVDIPGMVAAAGINAGLRLIEECPALIAGIRDGRLISRASFFQQKNVRTAIEAGDPQWLQQHEEILIFRAALIPVQPPSENPRHRIVRPDHRLDVLAPNDMDRRPHPARGSATEPRPDQGRKCGRTPDSCPPNPQTTPGSAPSDGPDLGRSADHDTPHLQADSSDTAGRR